jgi:hypothetical protein
MAKPDPIASPSHPATSKRTTPERTASNAPCKVADASEVAVDGTGALPLVDDEGDEGADEELGVEAVVDELVGGATVTVTVDVPVPPAPPRAPQDAAVTLHASSTTPSAGPEYLMTPPRFATATRWRLDVPGEWHRPLGWSSPR